jgi:hypothetical protein
MIDDIIEEGIGAARRAAPAAKMASEAAQMTAQQTADYVKELGATFDQLKPIVNLPNIQKIIREEFESPPIGAIAPDALGFSSRLSESVDKLQDKGTGTQFLAQLSKMKGVPLAEIKVTGLDEYLKNTPKVTKQEVQDYLETNRLQLIEDERRAGAGRLDKEVIQYLPRQFDWLDRYDLDEEFIDKAHLRNHLVRTLDEHFDDLEAEADNKGGFHARDRSGEVRYIPASKRFEWRESEIDKIDNELEDLPNFNGATKYPDEYQIPGGENYREILYKLPDDKVEGVFRPPPSHFDNAENTFGSIRATDRDIDGKPVLFAEEIQSDWSIKGSQGGYLTPEKLEEKNKLAKQLDALGDEYSKLLKVVKEKSNTDPEIAKALEPKMQELVRETTKTKNEYNRILREVAPDNPFRGNWYKPVVNNFLVKAAKEGKQGIGFPTGQIIADRYNLSKAVDAIEWNTYAYKSGNKYKTIVFRNFGDQGVIEVDVNPETGVIKEISSDLDMTPDWEGKNIVDVVGKGVAEKIMKDKSGLLDEEGLKIGGKGKDKLYDEMIPKQLKEIGDKYGVQLEKRTIPFGEGDRTESEVYFFPITEEMRADLLNQGLPMFKQGGHVQKYSKGGKVLKEIAKGAKQAAKQASRQERVDKNLKKFLEDSQVKGRLYHGTRENFPSFDTSLSEFGTHIGPLDQAAAVVQTRPRNNTPMGENVMPVYAQAKNPLRLIDMGDFSNNTIISQLIDRGIVYPSDVMHLIDPRMGGFGYEPKYSETRATRQELQNLLKDKGFDSVVYLNRSEGLPEERKKNMSTSGLKISSPDEDFLKYAPEATDSYILFDPTQIKSAIGNRGSFDPTNPDITKAKGGALRSVMKGTKEATDQVAKAQKMLQGVYRGYTGERLAEPVLSTTPQKRVAEYYANRRAAERGEDPHLEMLMVDPFAGKQYGLSLPIDQYNRDFITTRARAITPEDVAERIQLKKRGGLASLSR